MARVANKRKFYEMYELGLFGNKPLTWKSRQEILDSGWKGKVCIRAGGSRNGMKRSRVGYNIPLANLKSKIEQLVQKGIPESDLFFNQSMPDRNLTFQGELMRGIGGLNLHYTYVKKPMNKALKISSYNTQGLEAKMLLQKHLSPSSLSDIYCLLDIFPESIIEFSAYRIPVGNIPGRNTIIWEVRNY